MGIFLHPIWHCGYHHFNWKVNLHDFIQATSLSWTSRTDFQAWHQQWLAYYLALVESQLQDSYRLYNCFSRETNTVGLTNAQKDEQHSCHKVVCGWLDK